MTPTQQNKQPVEFSLKNFYKNNTPEVALRVGRLVKAILGVFTAGGIVDQKIGQELPWWFSLFTVLLMIATDHIVDFWGYVKDHSQPESLTVSGPPEALQQLQEALPQVSIEPTPDPPKE